MSLSERLLRIVLKIDVYTTSRYQAVIDFTQRKPAWWIEHCAYLYAVMCFLSFAFMFLSGAATYREYISLACGVLISTAFLCTARSPSFLVVIGGQQFFRVFIFWALLYSTVFMILAVGWSLELLFEAVTSLAFTSVYYFASCKPPAPPRRKEKLVPSRIVQ